MGSKEVLLSSRQPGYVLSRVLNHQAVTGSRGGEDAWGPGGDSEGRKTCLDVGWVLEASLLYLGSSTIQPPPNSQQALWSPLMRSGLLNE